METLLEVRDLSIHYGKSGFFGRRQPFQAVQRVSLHIGPGETLGLLGESGCGKSSLGRAIMRLVEPVAGQLILKGQDYTQSRGAALRAIRSRIQMVFQDPLSSLNPRHSVATILDAPYALHQPRLSKPERRGAIVSILDQVGLGAKALEKFPHEFSGGQMQRIAIARALLLKPELIICDEVVSALDVSVQSQVLNLLLDLQAAYGISYLFISHDLAVVRHIADRIAVMQKGQLVEELAAADLVEKHRHPYTRSLIEAVPCLPSIHLNGKV